MEFNIIQFKGRLKELTKDVGSIQRGLKELSKCIESVQGRPWLWSANEGAKSQAKSGVKRHTN